MTGAAEPKAAGGRLPDFFIVGHSKSGTTALYEMLRAHPQIFMPEMKEPIFFAKELPRQAHRYRAPETLEEYLALFADARPGQRLGEASASYLRSERAAERIAQAQPAGKIVAILREPASFLRSFHLQLLQAHYESERDLRRALALEPERRAGRQVPRRSLWPQELLYSDHVHYVEQLRRFERHFPPEQMLVLIYDDFRADNEASVRRVLSFLGVEETLPVPVAEANPTVSMRSQRVDDLLYALSTGQGRLAGTAKRALTTIAPREARRRALRMAQRTFVYGAEPPRDEALMSELRRRFKPEVQALGEHLGRDLLALWGYDRLD
jgi:hypothetical protein